MLKQSIKNFFIKKSRKRSVFFYGHSYYHFYYLAKALRKRGWDAMTVNLEKPDGNNAIFYHGEDLNLYHKNYKKMHAKINHFIKLAHKRFNLMHFAGDYCLYFHPENWHQDDPEAIVKWRNNYKKIAYTISGCNSATSPTSVARWSSLSESGNVCNKCIWQLHPDVCNDKKSLDWGKKLEKHCDIVFAETLPALDYIASHPNVIRDPVTMCLEPNVWSNTLSIPKKWHIQKDSNELLVYHAMANYELRTSNNRNIKGTPAVLKAVEKLQQEGINIRLIFANKIPNINVRYYQAQADVIVDQLNYGRYGANAREGMMLGKPVICYINKNELEPTDQLPCLDELPLVSATEDTIYNQLKQLLQNPSLRESIGNASRAYALKWHSADQCAERYEAIYDELFS